MARTAPIEARIEAALSERIKRDAVGLPHAVLGALAAGGLVLLTGAFHPRLGVASGGGALERAPATPAAAGTRQGHRRAHEATRSQEVQNLRAFAKLYGYVRYFHPSDAASATDWERLAVYGARQVRQAQNRSELRAILQRLFSPLAPTMQLYPTGETPPAPPDVLTPRDTTGLKLVAWQHRGVGLGNRGPYRSIRLNRKAQEPEGPGFGTIVQSLAAAPYQGKQVKLKAAVKADVSGTGNQAQLWLRVDRAGGQQGFFSNMKDRPVTSSTWSTYEITGSVAEDAQRIVFGGFLKGKGQAWLDDFQLLVRDRAGGTWRSVPLDNAGFEADANGEQLSGWAERATNYQSATTGKAAFEGEQSALITSSSAERRMAGRLFEEHPEAGKVVNKALGQGLSVQLPLALYSREGQTLRPGGAPSPERLRAELNQISLNGLTAEDAALRYGDVVVAWNVLQHFYPYFGVVGTDWNAVLTRALRRAAADETSAEFLQTLRRMVAQLGDGHGRVYHPLTEKRAGLPFAVDQVEGEAVITAVADSAVEEDACFRRGDVVVSIGGTPARDVLRQSKRYISGSPQWKTERALGRFGRGERGTSVRLTLRRGGDTHACRVARRFEGSLRPERPAPIEELRGGVYYVDLGRAEMSAIRERMQALADAEGVIFDMRGYPKGGAQAVLQHLTNDTLRSARWQVPQFIYPDQENRVGYDTTGRWRLPPKEPYFTGEVVFLTGPGAISYAESIMGIVEHYELGEIVGQATAGTNGNINPFTLPGGYRVVFTGMRVVKHDRSQHHLVGIQPTVPTERTLEDVREGRDTALQRALELIRTESPEEGR